MRALVVRLFEPAAGTGQVALCGLVEDVRTGSTWPFDGDEQLLRAITTALAGTPEVAAEIVHRNCWP